MTLAGKLGAACELDGKSTLSKVRYMGSTRIRLEMIEVVDTIIMLLTVPVRLERVVRGHSAQAMTAFKRKELMGVDGNDDLVDIVYSKRNRLNRYRQWYRFADLEVDQIASGRLVNEERYER